LNWTNPRQTTAAVMARTIKMKISFMAHRAAFKEKS
jgi:hypothetical protein